MHAPAAADTAREFHPPHSPDDADTVEGVIERLAVLFSEAEQMLRAAAERTGARLAVLAMPEVALADELREVLASAGFQVRVVPLPGGGESRRTSGRSTSNACPSLRRNFRSCNQLKR